MELQSLCPTLSWISLCTILNRQFMKPEHGDAFLVLFDISRAPALVHNCNTVVVVTYYTTHRLSTVNPLLQRK
jgi:hypothetical protein